MVSSVFLHIAQGRTRLNAWVQLFYKGTTQANEMICVQVYLTHKRVGKSDKILSTPNQEDMQIRTVYQTKLALKLNLMQKTRFSP